MDPGKALFVFDLLNILNGIGIFIPDRNRFLWIINFIRAFSIVCFNLYNSCNLYQTLVSIYSKQMMFWTVSTILSNLFMVNYFS